jgi:type IV secretion system protein VirD4
MPRTMRVRLFVVLSAAALGLGTLWFCTQKIAAALAYQNELGEHLELFAMRIYPPWAWIDWALKYYKYTGTAAIFDPAIETSVPLLAGVVFAIALALVPSRRASTAHGSARWAEEHELRKAHLLKDRGVVLCQTDDARLQPRRDDGYKLSRAGKMLTDDSDQHVIVIAPTGSGKGESAARPTCYLTKRSVVVVDIKGELYDKTAGYRKQFSHCVRFAPCERGTARINPLLYVRREQEVADVQNIADILVDPSGTKQDRSHWEKAAANLLVGTMLHVLYTDGEKSLARVRKTLQDPDHPIVETLEMMLRTPHLGDRPHETVARCARGLLDKPEKELGSVVSSAVECLNLWEDKRVAEATSESDIQIDDLMFGEHPVSLYLVIPASDLSRLAPLVRLILTQMSRRLVERLAKPKHKLLFLIDEFTALGRLKFFQTSLAFFRGYGIKCMIIIQSLNQLADLYGERNSIIDNCNIRLFFAANDAYTARQVSDLVGQATQLKKLRRLWPGRGRSRQELEQEHGRPLLTLGEVVHFPADEALLLMGGLYPYRGKKIVTYADPRFEGFDKLPAPATAQERARELPRRRQHEWESLCCRPVYRPKPPGLPAGGPQFQTLSGGQGRPAGSPGQPPSRLAPQPAPAPPEPGGAWVATGIDGAALLAEFSIVASETAGETAPPADDPAA